MTRFRFSIANLLGLTTCVVSPASEFPKRPSDVAEWIISLKVHRLTVAGNRESKWPGIGLRTEGFLARLFKMLSS
jgi:hypothetical protein